jgi:Mg/Co/Ni transporter MgtE
MPDQASSNHSAETKSVMEVSKAKERSINEEIEELLQMLQTTDAKQVLQSMNDNQRSLLRTLAK